MKNGNLRRALAAMSEVAAALRDAHHDAIESDHMFAEMAVFDLLETAHKFHAQIARVGAAALNDKAP